MGRAGDVAMEVLRDGAQLTVQTHNAVGAPSRIAMPPMGEVHAVRMISVDGQPGKKVEAGRGIVTCRASIVERARRALGAQDLLRDQRVDLGVGQPQRLDYVARVLAERRRGRARFDVRGVKAHRRVHRAISTEFGMFDFGEQPDRVGVRVHRDFVQREHRPPDQAARVENRAPFVAALRGERRIDAVDQFGHVLIAATRVLEAFVGEPLLAADRAAQLAATPILPAC